MTIGEFTQRHLVGDDDEQVSTLTIDTNGRQIRPVTALLNHLVDEQKLHVTEDGIWTRHVDPANVAMAYIHAHPAAFDSYDLDGDEFVAGIFCDGLNTAVANARKPHKDPVELRINENRTLVTISREYPMGTVEWADRLLNIDADAVRKEPDTLDSTIDDLSEWQATVEVDALRDAIVHAKQSSDHLTLLEDDGHLVAHATRSQQSGPLSSDDDGDDGKPSESVVDFGSVAEPTEDGGKEGAKSLFSIDYLVDQVEGLKAGGIYQATVVWGDECPMSLRFEHENDDGDTLAEGALHLAPRIESV